MRIRVGVCGEQEGAIWSGWRGDGGEREEGGYERGKKGAAVFGVGEKGVAPQRHKA